MTDYAARMARLGDLLKSADAVLLVPGANLRYFTGLDFHLSERPTVALFTDAGLSLIVPELEVPRIQARPDLDARLFTWGDKDGFSEAFRAAGAALNLRLVALDGLTMRVFEWQAFLETSGTRVMKLRDAARDLLNIRATKTHEEVAAMRKAISISEAALEQLVAWIQPGMTEAQIARRLEEEMTAFGAQGFAFESLVQTGPNSALPHGNTSTRALREGELLLIDFGAKYQGYPADITRTFIVGVPSDELRRMHDAVLAANEAARKAAGPGVRCTFVDKAARDVLKAAGYGDYFIHRTGHGLGLETHELPQIAEGVEAPLQPGMVFTIEPGVYIPGVGGVRIEDNMLITENGAETLTSYPRGWTLLP